VTALLSPRLTAPPSSTRPQRPAPIDWTATGHRPTCWWDVDAARWVCIDHPTVFPW
jgi:hypothetical protein